MRNNHKIILAGAIALATLFTACQREQAVDNPNYNAEEGTVKTQFVLNVATANTPTTKQSAENTQATTDKTFRGMEEAALLAYNLDYNLQAAGGGSHVFDMTPAKATATRKYNLGNLLAVGEIKEDQSRRVMELALPVGTNALLFYGKAPKGSLTNKAAGSVTMSIAEKATDTEFTIGERMTYDNRIIYNETTDLFATCMNMLSNAALKLYKKDVDVPNKDRDLRYAFYWPINNASDVLNLISLTQAEIDALPADGAAGTGAHAGQTFHIGETSWPELGAKYLLNNDETPSNDVTLTPNQEILGQTYAEFTTIRSVPGNNELRELRAGSGSALQAVVSDLYSVADRVSKATPSFWEGQTAVLLARRIKAIIETCFTGTAGSLLSYGDIGNIKSTIAQYVLGKDVTQYSHVLDLAGFPGNIDMPNGSAIITFDKDSKTWSYLTSIPAYGMSGGAQDVNKYLFPAELMYFGNSPVRVTDDAHENAHYPNTVGTWDDDATWASGGTTGLAGATGWTKDGAVKSTTRSVAMQKDINYGTALLESKVKYGAATLKDNNHKIQEDRTGADEPDIEIPVEGNTFRLTGIIVGGQINKVGWNYVNKGSSFDYMVYDNDITNGSIPATGTSAPNYTLVWDNWNSTLAKDAQTPVYVALEFVNNAKDFWGNTNRVRKGGTFYLVGKLNPAGKAFPTRSATNYNLPPYEGATGTTVEASRVFIQDFVTKVTFTIGANSLKNAYVTVPDLRSSEISLALSVDIQWETGLDFGNVVLGE